MLPTGGKNLLTENMIEEEQKMEENAKIADQKMFEEMKQREENMTKEMCYKRLEHLLSRSNFYTQFLLKRMKEQQQLKDERRSKGLMQRTKENKSPPTKNVETRKSSQRTRNGSDQVALTKKTENEATKKKGQPKRKLNQLNISDYYTEESLAKRQKADGENKDKLSNAVSDAADTFCRVINDEKVSDRQPRLFTGGVMRDYQLDGLDWLKLLYENGVNGILGDEMGLGKTIQCIALIAHLVDMGVPGPFMVCAPLSTLPNWISEFKRFAPKVPVILYHGTRDERAELIRQANRAVDVDGKETKPTVVTSYEIVMQDQAKLMNFSWRYLIVDEGHRIKNFSCRLVKELKRLNTANRLLLTGTPLQNNLSELWSLLNFLLPEIFDDLQVFQSWFDVTMLSDEKNNKKIIEQEKEKQIIGKLHQILTPFLLRRVKTDVALNIPPKKEVLVYGPMSSKQQTFYQATVDRTIEAMFYPPKAEEAVILNDKGRPERRCSRRSNYAKYFDKDENDVDAEVTENHIDVLKKGVLPPMVPIESHNLCQDDSIPKSSAVSISMRHTLMLLRKICNHPYLIDYPLVADSDCYLVDDNIIETCGKMQILDMMLKRLKSEGHKVLIFSQMTKMLDILGDYCGYRKYTHCRLDGTMKIQDRQEEIHAFNHDPDIFIFLLSTRAGGLGINLTAADTVIIYDSDWNPQCDLQAQDRCHRIGQAKPVVVYRFVAAGTIDEKIVERASSKRKLEKMIIHKGKFKSGRASIENSMAALSTSELLDILKSKDHQRVSRCTNGKIYSESELDMLLDRSDLFALAEKEKPNPVKNEGNLFKVVGHDSVDKDIQF